MDTMVRQNFSLTAILSFQGAFRFLSNFWSVEILFDGITFPSVEHAYQAAKTLDPAERHGIAKLETPGMSKRVGSKLTLRKDWEFVKIPIMTELLLKKFDHPDLKANLLGTNLMYLEEGNIWHDNFWGSCVCTRCQRNGKNILGILLMAVREKVRLERES